MSATAQSLNNMYFEYLSKQLDIISSLSEIGLIVYDMETHAFFVSKSARLICGMNETDVLTGDMFKTLIHPDDMDLVNEIYEDFVKKKGKLENFSQLIRVMTGKHIYEWFMVRAVYMYSPEMKPLSISFSYFNATFETVSHDLFDKLAFYDDLTGLPNKRKFVMDCKNPDELHGLQAFCILSINDSYAFNQISIQFNKEFYVKKFADILKTRFSDQSLYAYLDNSMFAFILPVSENYQSEASEFFQYLQDEFQEIANNKNDEFKPILKGGYCLFGKQFTDKLTCMENATIAFKISTTNNKLFVDSNLFVEYEEMFKKELVEKEHLIMELQYAIEHNEFVPYYQPKINPFDNRLCGMEALIRWKHPQKGIISPAIFIPLAEETGLILEISRCFMEKVCTQNKLWQDNGLSPTKVSLNISPLEFYDSNILETVQEILEKTGLDAKWVELEITEGVALTDMKIATQKMSELAQLGLSIAIDDFGSGYSSLSYLKTLPADTIKIDRSLIMDIDKNQSTYHIAEALAILLKKLDKKFVCEGVETEEQVELLKSLGYNCIQGYFYSKPLPADEFEKQYLR